MAGFSKDVQAEMLRDLKRSGLTAADAKIMQLEPVDGKHPGYKIPYHNIKGKLTGHYRIRYFDGPQPLDKNGKPMKYGQPKGSKPELYFPPLTRGGKS